MTTPLRHVFASIDELAPRIAFLPLLLFRVTVGWVFLQSGWGKLHNLEGVTEFFVSLGIPAAHLQAPIVSGIEFGCGLLLLLGLATRVVAAPLVGVMAVAIGTALWADIEDLSDLFALAEFGYIVILIALVVFGGGVLSLDAVVRRRLASRS
ncbi:MAG: DoxX family protein [Myxococcota bacterium]